MSAVLQFCWTRSHSQESNDIVHLIHLSKLTVGKNMYVFDVLMSVTMKSIVLWVVMMSRSERSWRFGRTFPPHPHHQGQRISHTKQQQDDLAAAFCGFLFCLHCDPEDGGVVFLWNVGLPLNYTVLWPGRQFFSIYVDRFATVLGPANKQIRQPQWAQHPY